MYKQFPGTQPQPANRQPRPGPQKERSNQRSDNCKACAFFEDHKGNKAELSDGGLCHFNPPVARPEADARASWPVVSAEDWCSRFEAQAA